MLLACLFLAPDTFALPCVLHASLNSLVELVLMQPPFPSLDSISRHPDLVSAQGVLDVVPCCWWLVTSCSCQLSLLVEVKQLTLSASSLHAGYRLFWHTSSVVSMEAKSTCLMALVVLSGEASQRMSAILQGSAQLPFRSYTHSPTMQAYPFATVVPHVYCTK